VGGQLRVPRRYAYPQIFPNLGCEIRQISQISFILAAKKLGSREPQANQGLFASYVSRLQLTTLHFKILPYGSQPGLNSLTRGRGFGAKTYVNTSIVGETMLRHRESEYRRLGINIYPAWDQMNRFGTERWLRRIASQRAYPRTFLGGDR